MPAQALEHDADAPSLRPERACQLGDAGGLEVLDARQVDAERPAREDARQRLPDALGGAEIEHPFETDHEIGDCSHAPLL